MRYGLTCHFPVGVVDEGGRHHERDALLRHRYNNNKNTERQENDTAAGKDKQQSKASMLLTADRSRSCKR